MLILRAKTALNVAICMIFFNIFLDNGVMNTPKRRILSLVCTLLKQPMVEVQYPSRDIYKKKYTPNTEKYKDK